jgi:hypothetical protein
MPFNLPLPDALKAQGWRVKIFDKERLEPPHVTVIGRTGRWRIGLRDMEFLDKKPPPSDVPDEVLEQIIEHLETLKKEWDAKYPENPIGTDDGNN